MPLLFASLDDFPENIHAELTKSENAERNRQIFERFALADGEKKKAVLAAVRSVFLGSMALRDFPAAVGKAAGLADEATASAAGPSGQAVPGAGAAAPGGVPTSSTRQMAIEFIGQRFLPLAPLLGDVAVYLKELGVDPAKYPQPMVVVKKSLDEAVKMLLDKLPERAKKPETLAAWQEFFAAVVGGGKEKFDSDEARAVLMREAKGGFALTVDEAGDVVRAITRVLAEFTIEVPPAKPVAPKPSAPTVEAKPVAPVAPEETAPKPVVKEPAPKAPLPPAPAPIAAPAPATPPRTPAAVMASKLATPMPPKPLPPSPPKPTPSPATSFLDAHEEDELKNSVAKPPLVDSRLVDTLINSLIAKAPPPITSEEMKKRLSNGLRSRIKGARTAAEFLAWLMKGYDQGGMGMIKELAQTYNQVIEESKKVYDHFAARSAAETAPTTQKELIQDTPRAHPEEPPVKLIQDEAHAHPAAPAAPSAPPTTTSITPNPSKPSTPAPRRPQMTDITPPYRVFGPVEEISAMTLIDFRRLSPRPDIARQKIEDKIRLIREDSWHNYAAALNGWRGSEPYRLYQEILAESITGRALLITIIKNHLGKNEYTLTEEEFRAIMELNDELRR